MDSPQDAVKLVTHMPYAGHVLTVDALNVYAGPVVEQSVNQIVQLTPLEHVNERIHDITELVRGHLQEFLSIYGIMLNDVKILIRPKDERMRELISLRAFGLSELDAVRYYVAMKMAERGLDELMQFDWALVGEADELAALLSATPDLAAIDQASVQQRLRRLTEVIADRRRYADVMA